MFFIPFALFIGTQKFCNMCGRGNQFFDNSKPGRLEKAQKLQWEIEIRDLVKQETEAMKLSQDCVNDAEKDTDISTSNPDGEENSTDPGFSGDSAKKPRLSNA